MSNMEILIICKVVFNLPTEDTLIKALSLYIFKVYAFIMILAILVILTILAILAIPTIPAILIYICALF